MSGGELTLTKLGDTPIKDEFPIEKHGRISNAQLKSGAIDVSATGWVASPILEPTPGNTVSLFLMGESYQEITSVFDKLAEGAYPDTRTFQIFHSAPFGSYGQFTDKYGVGWVFKAEKVD